jgi:predicted nucleic acid-binding protein
VTLILDSNALSAAAEREPGALERVARAERIAVPVIVLGEYRLGIAQTRHYRSYKTGFETGLLQCLRSTSRRRPRATTQAFSCFDDSMASARRIGIFAALQIAVSFYQVEVQPCLTTPDVNS